MIYPNLILNDTIFNSLVKSHKLNRLPHAIILHGNSGVGKEGHAIEFSAYLNCEVKEKLRACGRCSNCIRISSFQHSNVKLIIPMPASNKPKNSDGFSINTLSLAQQKSFMNALKEKENNPYYKINLKANSIPIDIIRHIRKDLFMSSIEEGWRIIIIFDAEKLCTGTQASANALLKILEEPPEKTLFILTTSYQNQLLETIKSRCQSFYFTNHSVNEIKQFFQNKNIEEKKSYMIAKMSDGNLGIALQLIENYESIPKDIEIIFEAFFSGNDSFNQKFQNRLQDLNRVGNRELFDNFFQIQLQLIRDLMLIKMDEKNNEIIFFQLKRKYLQIIKDNPKAHFHSMLEAIEDTIYMDQGNVNLSLNAISLIFDIQSCLRGNEYQPVIKF
ncbi:MAG: hypothetical protein CMF96_12300 [Candidatus Marinimicrobia bacterium]|nr:hypothetical protein [Candidatus Neomarinimicrobiota bacterium]|tara:strand:- start:13354 stop:14517 length:1164 start_codon:yes stop_codon:yes gene_type:complete